MVTVGQRGGERYRPVPVTVDDDVSTISVPSTDTVTVDPGTPVPVTVGVLSVIVEPLAGAVMTGAGGAVVSTVKVTSSASEVLPAGSVCVADAVCSPSDNAVVGVTDQLPAPLTGLVPISVPSMLTVTVAPGSPVPLIAGSWW